MKLRTTKPALLLLASLAATASYADIAWLDVQSPDSPVATLHQVLPAGDGASVVNGPVKFTLLGDGIVARNREFHDPMLRDFASLDGDGAVIVVRIDGLPAGNYIIESWHYDRSYPGAIEIACGPAGQPQQVVVPKHAFSTVPALYSLRSDGKSSYEISFRDNNDDNRTRLNALHLRAADEPESPPGIFVDIGYANTTTVSGVPDPFFTTDATDPGFLNGPLWRLRTGYGLNMGGNRDIFEKDANDAIGNASPLVTINSLGADQIIEFSVTKPLEDDPLTQRPAVNHVHKRGEVYALTVAEIGVALPALLAEIKRQQSELVTLTTHQATLEDVFVSLTGRMLRDG